MEESKFYSLDKNRKLSPINFEITEKHVKIDKRDLLRRNIIGVHHEISKNPDDKFCFLKFFYYPVDLKPKRCITEKREILIVAVFDKHKSRYEEIILFRDLIHFCLEKRMKNMRRRF